MNPEWSKHVFAKNLRWYMESTGKTQKELAEIAGVSAPTFNNWLSEKKYPRIDKIQRLADYFGILKSDLIEEKKPSEAGKDNDAVSDIIVRLRMDKDFLVLVESLCKMDATQIAGIQQMLNALSK